MKLDEVMGLSWDQINRMGIKDLRTVTRVVADVANKRYNRLSNSDYIAKQAYNSLKESGGKVTTKGMNVNQLRNELNRARAFINMKTSTMGTAKKVYKTREKALYGDVAGTREQAEQRLRQSNKVEELYGKYLQLNPTANNTLGSETVRGLAAEAVEDNPDMSIDDLLEELSDLYSGAYEEENGDEFDWEGI